jgi:hypothetical protein
MAYNIQGEAQQQLKNRRWREKKEYNINTTIRLFFLYARYNWETIIYKKKMEAMEVFIIFLPAAVAAAASGRYVPVS